MLLMRILDALVLWTAQVLLVLSLMRAATPDPRDGFRTVPVPRVDEERQETLQQRQEYQQLLADMRHDMAQVLCKACCPGVACVVLTCQSSCGTLRFTGSWWQAPPGEIPPYPIRQLGEYKGWLWTVGPDTFDTSQVRHTALTCGGGSMYCPAWVAHAWHEMVLLILQARPNA